MIRKLSRLAIMACLAGSLAFAGDKKNPTSSADNVDAKTTQATGPQNTQRDGSTTCASAKDKKKNKRKTEPAPTDQEREFDRVLQER